jgi:hypothetical protein
MKRGHLFLLISALAASLPAVADERLFLQVPAAIAPTAPMPDAIRKECAVDQLVAAQTLLAMNKRISGVQAVEDPALAGGGNLVELSVMAANGEGGGGFTGPKSMTVRAILKKNGVTVATTLFTRTSGRGMTTGFLSGTCSVMDRIAGALGKDVAVWLTRDVGTQAGITAGKTAD